MAERRLFLINPEKLHLLQNEFEKKDSITDFF